MELLAILLSIIFAAAGVLLFLAVYTIAAYCLESAAIMKMYKNMGEIHAARAWIPFYKKYMLGKFAGRRKTGRFLALVNLAIAVIIVAAAATGGQFRGSVIIILVVLPLLLITSFITNMVISGAVFRAAGEIQGTVMTVASVFTLGLLRPIFLFAVRNVNKFYVGC